MLWVEMPTQIDVLVLAQRMERHRIKIAPGGIFSASGKYRNCVRLNYARGTEEVYLAAIHCIGSEVKQMLTATSTSK
jgi:DNA-binding transcriptional MocR family regulator